MKVKTKKTEEEIQKALFEPLPKAATSRVWEDANPSWCELSEFRLYTKIVEHKPAGICKQFNVMALVDFMNNIYEDENADFDELLSPDDLEKLKKRRENPDPENILVFRPKYRIRPTTDQILEKVKELWDLDIIEHNEYIPERIEVQDEFYLPAGDFSELLRKKEDSTSLMPTRKKRRGGSPDSFSSRCSTPAMRS
ncbi:unnamed protein product [Auanema sp. JU1783]|nr:unnamed protein product [Auanema sp. JU1783]